MGTYCLFFISAIIQSTQLEILKAGKICSFKVIFPSQERISLYLVQTSGTSATQSKPPKDTIPNRYQAPSLGCSCLMKRPPPESPLQADLPASPPAHTWRSGLMPKPTGGSVHLDPSWIGTQSICYNSDEILKKVQILTLSFCWIFVGICSTSVLQGVLVPFS